MPRSRKTDISSSPKSPPTTPTTRTSVKKLADEREVRRRPAEHPLALTERRLDRVERHRTDYEQ